MKDRYPDKLNKDDKDREDTENGVVDILVVEAIYLILRDGESLYLTFLHNLLST
jgi:hypothetical protein